MTGLILAAAGTGSRFGSTTPKQFLDLGGKPVYRVSLEKFKDRIEQAVVVVPETWVEEVEGQLEGSGFSSLKVTPGGAHRQESVARGLEALDPAVGLVLVHDAARPFLSSRLIGRVVEGARSHGACVPVVPVPDTIKEVSGERVVRTVDRSPLQLAQTPEGFRTRLLRRAFEQAAADSFVGTDEAMLVERLGHEVRVVEGDPANRKITWKEDLQ